MGFAREQRRFGSAHGIALLALFVALFGTAYAATINGNDITNNSIAGKKLKRNTVKGSKVNEASLTGVNAAKLGGNPASAFEGSGAVVGGAANPTVVSQTMLTIPDLNVQVETDNAATALDVVTLRAINGASITEIHGDGPADFNTFTGTFDLFVGSDFRSEAGVLEVLLTDGTDDSVLTCYFTLTAVDYCQATTA
jgi:hypothetical protein